MTWGCSESIEGDGLHCLRCRHISACRVQVAQHRPVACEAPDEPVSIGRPPHQYMRNYRDVLSPGMEFTAHQLAEWTGKTGHQARGWCADGVRRGELQLVGTTYRISGNGTAYIYRYVGFAGSLDAVTGIHPTPKPWDVLDSSPVTAPIELTSRTGSQP